jgi:hypothetical protein
MSDSLPDYTDFLRGQATLRLVWIVNIASGLPIDRLEEWPMSEVKSDGREQRLLVLKSAIGRFGVRYYPPVVYPNGKIPRFVHIEPDQLLDVGWFRENGQGWVHDVCRKWATANGIECTKGTPEVEARAIEALEPRTTRRLSPAKELNIRLKLKQGQAAIKSVHPTRPSPGSVTADQIARDALGSRDCLPDGGYGFSSLKNWINGKFQPANSRGYQDPWLAKIK